MFEGVDDIQWEQFGDCHIAVGMKTHEIPDSIRNMLHENPEKREYAIASLLGEGQHLGMLGKATPYIIPYVLEVLAIPNYEARGYLLLGLGSMFEDMFHTQSFAELRLQIQVYDAIRKGYALFKRLLDDPNKRVREDAATIMGYMQDDGLDALSILLQRITLETDTEVRAAIIDASLKLVKDRFPPYSDVGKQSLGSLCGYLKAHGSADEQVQFARIIQGITPIYFQKDIMTFVQEVFKSRKLNQA